MIEVTGLFNAGRCFADALESSAERQIRAVCDRPEFAGGKIRVMPDVHAGIGCSVGTTMTITDKVVPGMVGVDIGCGMETVGLAEKDMDGAALDALVRARIPSGCGVRESPHELNSEIDLGELRCVAAMDLGRARLSVGSLGGGNHFIEVDRSDAGDLYLVVHSGSRHLGAEVAKYYQDRAVASAHEKRGRIIGDLIAETVARLREEGRAGEIDGAVRAVRADPGRGAGAVPRDLCYLEGGLFDDYVHDMRMTQRFAALMNRLAMTAIILEGMNLTETDRFSTVHNYIDTDSMILRKGAVFAEKGERLLVPINMRDGSLICVGRGNGDWNRSAPHGAGRLMSRSAAFASLSMGEYVSQMAGIFTTSVSRETLDEFPMAYKPIGEIIRNIGETAEIIERIRPVYDFKAGDGSGRMAGGRPRGRKRGGGR